MKAEYDFSKMKSRKNPYASKLKKQVTIRMSEDVIDYFKQMAEETGILAGADRRMLPPGDTQFGKRGSHVTRGDSISSFIRSARMVRRQEMAQRRGIVSGAIE